MTRLRLLPRLSVLLLAVLVFAGCTEDENNGDPTATSAGAASDAASPASDTAVAQVTATATNGGQTATVPGGVYIATPPSEEAITRAVPTGPAPAAPIGPQPTRTSQFDSNGDGFYTYEEFEQAVAALYPSYEWPDNYQVNPDTLLNIPEQYRDSNFEAGGEYTVIGTRHRCAWVFAWLDGFRAGDDALMAESLHQLRTVALTNPMLHSSVRELFEEMIQRAELGDPAMMQQWVTANCNPADFISATPTAGSSAAAAPAAMREPELVVMTI